MNTRTIIFAATASLLVLVVIVLFFIFSFKTAPNTPPSGQAPVPTTEDITGSPSLLGFRLIKVTPANNASGISVNTPISFEFNKPVADTSPAITFTPQTNSTYSFSQNVLLITPSSALLPATGYTVTVNLGGQTFFTVFNTTGPAPTIGKSTLPTGQAQQDQEYLKANRPDIFISNYVPYQGSTFSVTSGYSTGQDRFIFTVTAKNTGVNVKQDFLDWAKSKGLNDAQAGQLLVTYK
ncbi:MAG: Ig-like domain-containing protein [Candidatus Levyibacteriota bacterium]